jgi:hypothetical protein
MIAASSLRAGITNLYRRADLHVMAVTIRRAIDAVAPLFATNPNLDVESYAQELVTLFDRATRKE